MEHPLHGEGGQPQIRCADDVPWRRHAIQGRHHLPMGADRTHQLHSRAEGDGHRSFPGRHRRQDLVGLAAYQEHVGDLPRQTGGAEVRRLQPEIRAVPRSGGRIRQQSLVQCGKDGTRQSSRRFAGRRDRAGEGMVRKPAPGCGDKNPSMDCFAGRGHHFHGVGDHRRNPIQQGGTVPWRLGILARPPGDLARVRGAHDRYHRQQQGDRVITFHDGNRAGVGRQTCHCHLPGAGVEL